MISLKSILLVVLTTIYVINAQAQVKGAYRAVYSGVPWFDDRIQTVSAHGANVIKDHGKFYLFGEAHSDTSNAFNGFNCYSSTDLYNWKFERVALPVQSKGRLSLHTVGERPKVLKCPKTGLYVMLMHTDSLNYKNQCVGYATSKSITGPYIFKGPILFNGQPIKKWDMGTFQDSDGSGYLLIHGGLMYKLSDDFENVTEQIIDNKWRGAEAPAIFKKNGIYFWLASDLTSWERNDNFYYTATSLKGPWISQGNFAPKGSLTWNSQATFVLPVTGLKDTTYMYMGDRWSFPRQASAATYVWQPLIVSGTKLSIPEYTEAWQINTSTAVIDLKITDKKSIIPADQKSIIYRGKWTQSDSHGTAYTESNEKGAEFSVKFSGTQIGFYSITRSKGGYAKVSLTNEKGKMILSAIVDMYSLTTNSTLSFLSPDLEKGNYTLVVSVLGEHSSWSDKRKSTYGSTGDFVTLSKIVINP